MPLCEIGGLKVNTLERQVEDSDLFHVFCVQNEIKFLVDTGSQRSLLPIHQFNPAFEIGQKSLNKTFERSINKDPI